MSDQLVRLEREGDVFILNMAADENRWNTSFVRAFDAALDEVAGAFQHGVEVIGKGLEISEPTHHPCRLAHQEYKNKSGRKKQGPSNPYRIVHRDHRCLGISALDRC